MRHSIPFLLSCVFVTACAAAQVPATFDKSYPLNGRAELEVNVGNASVQTRSCGRCGAIHLHLEMNGQDVSKYRLEESQSGNHVRFELKQRESMHWDWNGMGKQPAVTVEVPEQAALQIHSGNGSLQAAGVRGEIDLNTGNGSISVENASGTLRLHSGNGSLTGHGLEGELKATTGNGSIHIDGRFRTLDAHSGNGTVEIAAGGGGLRDGSTITTGSGSVTLRLARETHATMRLSTGSGGIHSDLPLTTQGDLNDRHELNGTLNGGGGMIRVNTGSGSIHLEAL